MAPLLEDADYGDYACAVGGIAVAAYGCRIEKIISGSHSDVVIGTNCLHSTARIHQQGGPKRSSKIKSVTVTSVVKEWTLVVSDMTFTRWKDASVIAKKPFENFSMLPSVVTGSVEFRMNQKSNNLASPLKVVLGDLRLSGKFFDTIAESKAAILEGFPEFVMGHVVADLGYSQAYEGFFEDLIKAARKAGAESVTMWRERYTNRYRKVVL